MAYTLCEAPINKRLLFCRLCKYTIALHRENVVQPAWSSLFPIQDLAHAINHQLPPIIICATPYSEPKKLVGTNRRWMIYFAWFHITRAHRRYAGVKYRMLLFTHPLKILSRFVAYATLHTHTLIVPSIACIYFDDRRQHTCVKQHLSLTRTPSFAHTINGN